MRRLFIDTNVILDVLLQRDCFWQDSIKIFQFAELGKVTGIVSASSLTDIFYIAKKKLTNAGAKLAIENLLSLFEVVNVGKADLKSALTVAIDDYEDALQVHCAIKANADTFVTRDVAGFPNVSIKVVSPSEFKHDTSQQT